MRVQGPRVLAAVSGMIAVAVGAILAAKAPCFLVEYVGYADYSIGPFTPFPILPALMVLVGLFTSASGLKGRRHLSLLSTLCLGFLITSLTFGFPDGGGFRGFRIRKFGYPLGWLAEFIPPMLSSASRGPEMGVIALPFLIDGAFWTVIVGAIILAAHRLWSHLSGRRGMEKKMHIHLKMVEAAWLLAWMVKTDRASRNRSRNP